MPDLGLTRQQQVTKRVFDLLVGRLLLILTAPVILVSLLIARIDTKSIGTVPTDACRARRPTILCAQDPHDAGSAWDRRNDHGQRRCPHYESGRRHAATEGR